MKLNNVAADVNHTALSYAGLQTIEQRGASAFYFLDVEKLKHNYQQFHQAFVGEYEHCQIAYSFKTNYTPMVCQTLKSLGCWAEVVSSMEYDIATGVVGYPPQQVIINGPVHEPAFIERALLEGALINVDGWYLLDQVAQICAAHPGQQFRIGIRLTYAIAEGGVSRFGIESSDDNLQRLAQWQNAVSNCRIVGFHSHFSNSSRSLVSFDARINGLLSAIERFFTGGKPEFINIGGGFFGQMPATLAAQYGEQLPDFGAYAKLIGKLIGNRFNGSEVPKLLLEPGTAVVANAMVFVCKVIDVKQVAGKTLALVNGSNHNVNHKWQGESLPIQLVRQNPKSSSGSDPGCFDIVGNTCIEKDRLCSDIPGPVDIGDYVIFQYMGGYSNVLKQPFINPCQPVYGWQNQQLTELKRQETVADILATYL